MSGKRNLTARFDLERNETWRYDRREMAAAIAACEQSVMSRVSLAHAAYLSVHHRVLAVDYDLAGRRDHERRHHGGRLLALQQGGRAHFFSAVDFGQLWLQLRWHCVYRGGFRRLSAV